jgi:hypothetical protein
MCREDCEIVLGSIVRGEVGGEEKEAGGCREEGGEVC